MLQQAHLHGRILAAATIALATAPAAPIARTPAAAAALAPAPAAPADLLRGLRSRDCDNMLRVFKLQLQWVYDGDVLAIRVHVLLPRVQGRVLPGGALPFTTIAITTAPVARSPTAAVALTPAAAAAAAGFGGWICDASHSAAAAAESRSAATLSK